MRIFKLITPYLVICQMKVGTLFIYYFIFLEIFAKCIGIAFSEKHIVNKMSLVINHFVFCCIWWQWLHFLVIQYSGSIGKVLRHLLPSVYFYIQVAKHKWKLFLPIPQWSLICVNMKQKLTLENKLQLKLNSITNCFSNDSLYLLWDDWSLLLTR